MNKDIFEIPCTKTTLGTHCTYITFLLYFSVLPPPMKLELTETGKANENILVEWSKGIFILGEDLLNGFPYWLKTASTTEQSRALWFDEARSSWSIGEISELGNSFKGFIYGPIGNSSFPNEIQQGWQILDEPLDIIFKVILGTFPESTS